MPENPNLDAPFTPPSYNAAPPASGGNTASPRKGLAIASLIIGILSLPTAGLLLVGAISSIVMGIMALRRATNHPSQYAGKGLAIGGIVTGALSLVVTFVIVILAAIALPKLQQNLKSGREEAAIQSLRSIHNSQAQYNAAKGRFGTLKELVEAGLLSSSYASSQPVSGYIYSDSVAAPDRYCIHASRVSDAVGDRDFNVIEDGQIRFAESKTRSTLPCGQGDTVSR
jgi:type II secretory pathway pseudopilin PulG